MLVLIYSANFESTTNQVMHWLKYYGQEVLRINGDDIISVKQLSVSNESFGVLLMMGDKEVDLAQIKSYWYRRGYPRIKISKIADRFPDLFSNLITSKLDDGITGEIRRINEFIYSEIEHLPVTIGKHSTSVNNKIIHLQIAAKVGLKIPSTLVVTEKQALEDFRRKHGTIIMKAISEGASIEVFNETERKMLMLYTEEVTEEFVRVLPDLFFPSLVQEKLKKQYEVRVFFLKGECYSMAILSQNDERTKLDFRKYNTKKPNRFLPYKLPPSVDEKLKIFMSKADLDTGSIDIVYSNKEYYFLEVNPVGQFGMVSQPCNYHLEKKVAEILVNNSNLCREAENCN